ncbi:exported hypothetical protein [Candidatus Microthrix parvicella RN1]|jgi:hypothetical protein|uniref:Uncharacterized protein n=1 Tax=Candidatus Neomicrothrix parvicella RN1 TaxID=1229780 RepID=R4YW44_9ACTN|nr:exported hypothetical protein [Candidatus Microthrix parvicella RN1]
MRALRRGAFAMAVAGFVTAVLRLRGNGGLPPQEGGWHELTGPEYR